MIQVPESLTQAQTSQPFRVLYLMKSVDSISISWMPRKGFFTIDPFPFFTKVTKTSILLNILSVSKSNTSGSSLQ